MAVRAKSTEVRRRIVEAADDLLYFKGYNQMSFSDIAEVSGIPRGNLNYHFKTKEEVLSAVIESRLLQVEMMLDEWNRTIPSARERLGRFAQIAANEKKRVTRYGCPMGSLNTELGKTQQELQSVSRKQLEQFLKWLELQFREYASSGNARHLAMHMLVRTQGLAVVSQSFAEQAVIEREIESIYRWLDELGE